MAKFDMANFYVSLLQEGKTAKINASGNWNLMEQINSNRSNTPFLYPLKT